MRAVAGRLGACSWDADSAWLRPSAAIATFLVLTAPIVFPDGSAGVNAIATFLVLTAPGTPG